VAAGDDRRDDGGHQVASGRGLTAASATPIPFTVWQPSGLPTTSEVTVIRWNTWPLRRDPEWTRRPGASPPDAHACIMVLVPIDQPNTSLRRDIASKAGLASEIVLMPPAGISSSRPPPPPPARRAQTAGD